MDMYGGEPNDVVMSGHGQDVVVGRVTTKKCSADTYHKKERIFTCPGGSQYCSDNAPQQCKSQSPVFPWVEHSQAPAPVPFARPPHVSLEAEICLKIDDSMCAFKSQVCAAYGSEDRLCHMMDAVCKKYD